MGGWAQRTARTVYWALQRFKNAGLRRIDPPVLVLLYHRVTVLPSDAQLLAIAPDRFRAQLTLLKEQFRVVRLEDDWSELREPAVCLTFDDGYADNAREALPILEALGVPATFFVCTGHIGTDCEHWWDELESLLLGAHLCPAVFSLADARFGRDWPTATAAQRQQLYTALTSLAPTIERERLESWLGQLRAWSGQRGRGSGQNRSMTPQELSSLARSPLVTLGAHTVSHPVLANLSETEQRSEIFGSKETLERLTGTRVPVFSYPFGNRKQYDRTSVRLCHEAGFVKAAANLPGQAHRWTDPYQLPRQVVRDWDVPTFVRKLKNWV